MLRLALAGLVLSATALAQEPPPPSQAFGRVAGRVVNDAGTPVAGAMVTLLSNVPNVPTPVVRSDADGRFDIPGVPPSAGHRLSVSGVGLLQASTHVGKEVVRVFRVRPGERVDVTVTMSKGGAVTGRVVDEHGDPVQELQVRVLRYATAQDGTRALMPVGEGDLTDDRGEFRAFGLPPGEYVVAAVEAEAETVRGLRPNPLFGRLRTLPVYFPGTTEAAAAEPVTVVTAQDASITFAWRATPAFRISGIVVTPPGVQRASTITIGTAAAGLAVMTSGMSIIGADGSFAIDGVGPGEFLLTVQGPNDSQSFPVSVIDGNVSGVVVSLRPPRTISGRIVGDTTGPPQALRLVPADARDLVSLMAGSVVQRQDDGRFTVTSSASRVFFATVDGATVAEVTIDGDDVTDTGIDLSGDGIDNVRVRLTSRVAIVSGRVSDDDGMPLQSAPVIVQRLGVPRLPRRLALRMAQSDADGRFEVRGLRRGSYAVTALAEADSISPTPELLKELQAAGRRVSLSEGESVTVDLRPVRRPQ